MIFLIILIILISIIFYLFKIEFSFTKIFSNFKVFNKKECKVIKNIILENENYVKSLKKNVRTNTSLIFNKSKYKYYNKNIKDIKDKSINPLSERWDVFNWVSNTSIKDLIIHKLRNIFIKLNFKFPVSFQCWANTLRKNEGIRTHYHKEVNYPETFSGNIFISGNPNIGTTFLLPKNNNSYESCMNPNIESKKIKIKNKLGELIIFPGNLVHYVDQNPYDDIRISLSFLIFPGIDSKGYLNQYTIY